MTTYLTILAIILLITLLAGLGRVFKGPTTADRMLSVQLFGTTGVGILLLLGIAYRHTALLNVALVLALLAALTLIAYVRLTKGGSK